MYDRGQLLAGKLVAYTAKLHAMASRARMYFTSAAVRPFWYITISFNAALTYPIHFLPAAVTAFAAGSYCCKIYLLFHSAFTSYGVIQNIPLPPVYMFAPTALGIEYWLGSSIHRLPIIHLTLFQSLKLPILQRKNGHGTVRQTDPPEVC